MRTSFSDLAKGYAAFKDVMLKPNQKQAYLALHDWAAGCGKQEFAALCLAASEDLLESEASYNRLCIGPGRLLADPYESIWRSGERVMNNHYTAAVAYAYAQFGLVSSNEFSEMSDYFPNEVEFMFCLASAEAASRANGDTDLADAFAQAHDLFWSQHLGHWARQFLDKFCSESDSSFWTAFGYELSAFLESQNSHLELSDEMLGVEKEGVSVVAFPQSLKGNQK